MNTKQPEIDISQPLKSGRQELFCQGIIAGMSYTRAYIKAGYSENGADGHASRLVGKGITKARIAHIRAKIAESAEVTQEKQSAKLAWAQQHAKENGETSNYIKACEVQNRLYGLDKQVIEQSEQQKQLSKSQSVEAVRLADIRVREDMVANAEKVPQKATGEPEHEDSEKVYAMDWTNDSQDEDNTGPTGSHGPEQADKEQDGKQAIEG